MRSISLTRHLPVAVGVAGLALFAASPAIAGADHGRGEGPLRSYSADVPQGATAKVTAVYDARGKSTIMLHVKGLRPRTTYGAHAHVYGCGATGAAAGGHFQHVLDPVQPSVNPAYANPLNEIWLDVTTNAAGNGVARSVVDWQFTPDLRPGSVVIHALPTAPGGGAGTRLACLDVDF